MGFSTRYASVITEHSRWVVVALLIASVVVLPSILVLWERYGGTATMPEASPGRSETE